MAAAGGEMLPKPSTGEIRVAIVDGRSLIAEALAALIRGMNGFAVVDVLSWEQAGAVAAAQSVDLLLVGIGSKHGAAIEFIRSIRALGEAPEVVVLADSADPELLRFVLDQRLNGLLITDVQASDFAASLDQLARGHAVLPAGWQAMLATGLNDPVSALSARQMEVLELLSEGCSYEQIAERLFISVNTVKFHVRSIFSQLGVRNRVAAARLLSQRPQQQPPADTPPTARAAGSRLPHRATATPNDQVG
ncbi:MAG: response regulator transcription factor [Solirubrobacterales bacterium]|nr:response regulator transcription factor [Solirubrobacterales bacterium]